jgi:hypothetical protein
LPTALGALSVVAKAPPELLVTVAEPVGPETVMVLPATKYEP